MYLLDTCVVSEVAKADPDPAVTAWLEPVPETSLFLSVLTLGEIRKGMELLDPGPRRDRIQAWMNRLTTTFSGRMLAVDAAVAARWGVVSAEARRAGRPRPPVDSMLAATALCHDLAIVTRNVADFAGTGARVVNPWVGSAGS
jgi:predicted nucleic acid-binding protein